MSPRDALHRLVDDLPEGELPTATRVLEALRGSAQPAPLPGCSDLAPAGRYSNRLARLASTWSAEDLAEFEAAIAPMEHIDEELWR